MTITNNVAQKLAVAFVAAAMLFTLAVAPVAKAATDAELNAQIQTLLSQISALQGSTGGSTAQVNYTFTRNLTVGSRGDDVMQLQKFLNNNGFAIAQSGVGSAGMESTYFGPLTKTAVAKYQSAKGIDPAVGYFGPLTRTSVNASVASTVGAPAPLPTTTPSAALCPNGMTLASNCMAVLGTTTPALCPNGNTLASNCATTPGTTTTTTVGTNGYLTDFSSDSTNRVTTVYESETDKVVAGIRGTARLSSQNVDRVRVTFKNTDTVSSANLAKYISGVSLWSGTTKIGTLSVNDASRATSDDTYTFNFSGLKAPVAKDAIGRLYVSVNANGSLDSTDAATASWTVSFVSAGISASSPDGSYDTYPTTAVTQTGIAFKKFSSSGLKAEVNLATTNPASTVIAVNNTVATNGVTLLKFKIKATNSSLTLRKIPIQITLAPQVIADDVVNVINTVKLMRGANVIDTLDGSSGTRFTSGSASTPTGTACGDGNGTPDDFCSFQFINLSSPDNTIALGDTAEFSVVVDLKAQSNYTVGATLTAALANADVLLAANLSVQDTNGDQLAANSTVRVGSAVGNVMTLRVNGLQATMGTAAVVTTVRGGNTNPTDVIRATYTIPVTLSSFGQTLYVGQTGVYAAAAALTGISANTVSFGIQKASAPTATTNAGNLDTNVAVTASAFTCNGPIEGTVGAYRLDSNATVSCTLTVTLNNTTGNAALATEGYRVQLNDVRFFTANDLTTGAANQTLVPTNSYQTGYATGISKS